MMRLCYDAMVRTTIDLTDEAYHIAKSMAREENRSLGRVLSDLISRTSEVHPPPASATEAGFPVFRCVRRVTSEDVKALDDEE